MPSSFIHTHTICRHAYPVHIPCAFRRRAAVAERERGRERVSVEFAVGISPIWRRKELSHSARGNTTLSHSDINQWVGWACAAQKDSKSRNWRRRMMMMGEKVKMKSGTQAKLNWVKAQGECCSALVSLGFGLLRVD